MTSTRVEDVEYTDTGIGMLIRVDDYSWSFVPYVNTWYVDVEE